MRKIVPGKTDCAGYARLRTKKARRRQRDRAFAGSRFADQRDRLAAIDREADGVQRLQTPPLRLVRHGQIRDLEERGLCHPPLAIFSRGSKNSRRPSPSRFTPMTVTHMARPGASAIHGARSINGRASAIISPQSELGGCAPIPTKLNAAPSRIANVIRRLASTMIGGQVLGRISAARM